MAERVLIDRYLAELRHQVRRVQDAEEVIEEVADHLLEAVAANCARGLDAMAAERRALSEFGDPVLVGRAFAASRSGGAAVPTTFTRRSGVALIASSFLWPIAMALFYWSDQSDRSQPWQGLPQSLYLVGTLALMMAGALLVVGVLGLQRRHGGALGTTGRLAMWLAVATTITSFGAWAFGFWLTSLALGAVALAAALRGSGIAPQIAAVLIGLGGVVAAAVAWGYQIANNEVSLGSGGASLGIFFGLAVYAVGLASLGMWLRGEEPAVTPEPMATA